jgi:CheY-like chemotaxis protein
VLLIVENDLRFARFLLDTAREKGFKGLVTSHGAAALALVRDFNPAAVTLDIFLPVMEGWGVLERLKNDIASRHVPVWVISTEDVSERAAQLGAYGFVSKPIQGKQVLEAMLDDLNLFIGNSAKRVLLVEDDTQESLYGLLAADTGIHVSRVADGEGAVEALQESRFDCIVVNDKNRYQTRPDIKDELARIEPHELRGIVVYSQTKEEDRSWARLRKSNHRVRHVHSLDRMVDQVTLCLHRSFESLPEVQQQHLKDIYESNKPLVDRKVLIVDDDVRNIYALSSVLEDYGMNIVAADNGWDAIQMLQEQSNIDVVLMDIMMPEIDGIDTMREIRKIPWCKELPIIAVTAKAMKGDRERCIEAGAWDYLSKPVDTEKLLAVLRVWIHP